MPLTNLAPMLYTAGMIDKTFLQTGKRPVKGSAKPGASDLAYWLSRPAEERLAAVETLRRQYYGRNGTRLRRVVSVSERS